MTTTVGTLIQRGRDHHPAFTVANHPHRVALAFLSTRHQEILKLLASDLKDRLSEARKIADTIGGSLVGVDEDDLAFSVVTAGDGYAVIVGADGVPYLGDVVIASDPYATGFPMPVDSLHVVSVYATFTDRSMQEVTIRPQLELPRRSGIGNTLDAIVNGWRLIPLRNPSPSSASGDPTRWSTVAYVTFVWVPTPVRFDDSIANWENQLVALPDVYALVLENELAAYFCSREFARDPEHFPKDLIKVYSAQAADSLGAARLGVKTDHKGLRTSTTRRNR